MKIIFGKCLVEIFVVWNWFELFNIVLICVWILYKVIILGGSLFDMYYLVYNLKYFKLFVNLKNERG